MTGEPRIEIETREQLLHTLAEAAEIEHNLMCCYLYAAWSLKTEDDDGLAPARQAELRRWVDVIMSVAIDEMTHLCLVTNLINAVGGVAHFDRPNFPIAPGLHPADMNVHLAPFNAETLQHFVFLERPEGSDEPDGAGFEVSVAYARGLNGLKTMPSSQDYQTVGHLYRAVSEGLAGLGERLGETALFSGDPALQVGPDIVGLDGLIAITDLASAAQAIGTIVEQGEGAPEATEEGHYQRFVSIRTRLAALTESEPGFAPALPVATNPVMRRPPQVEGKVWVTDPDALALEDVANSLYAQMLRCLFLGFTLTGKDDKRRMIDVAIELMGAIVPLGRELARTRANDTDNCNAGMSFATLRSTATPVGQGGAVLAERLGEIRDRFADLPDGPRVRTALGCLERIIAEHPACAGAPAPAPAAPPPQPELMPVTPEENTDPVATPEVAVGRDITLIVDSARCIHSRFCVLGAPRTFLANVDGPWVHPDETPVARLVEIAHACPSGAITYRRNDGAADEAAPPVNVMRIRENGPYAIHAPISIDGEFIGYRATLCRCGQSKNKPFCDGSHHEAGFVATGEPGQISLDPLALRDGPLNVVPQHNGPLQVSGNLEICSGGGTVVQRVTQARLCRCGHSNNKPFCDGSHRRVGFQAP